MPKYRTPLSKVLALDGFMREAWKEVKDSGIATPKNLTEVAHHLDEIKRVIVEIELRLNKK